MSFYQQYQNFSRFSFHSFLQQVNAADVEAALLKSTLSPQDFLTLLSPAAEQHLEAMAQAARALSLQHFGKAILLFTPLYIANHCVNRCAYCSFNVKNSIHRKKLTLEEIDGEARSIAATGLRHILLLTGESRKHTPVSYIVQAVKILKRYFDSVSIEIYPLHQEEYTQVIAAGVDGLTVYQEVYDESIYRRVHLAGPKRDYRYRLDAPERACRAGIRTVNVGALLGLNHWPQEAFFTGLHAAYLQRKYPGTAVSISLPRIRPHVGAFADIYPVSEKNLVQVMLAIRLFLPFAGITITTRESAAFRDNLIPLGVNKMSAGVTTKVGGHTAADSGDGQFNIADTRSVREITAAIAARGYQPVFKDWVTIDGLDMAR